MRDIAILGAGPYGLSLAAHLAAKGADVRIFGHAMQSWASRMPLGMHMKSEGFASTLYDPEGDYRFSRHCLERGLPYADLGMPISVKNFAEYGIAFQQRFVPHLEAKLATSVTKQDGGFTLRLDDGEVASFRRVIVATGIQPFARMPEELADLPEALVSHSVRHHDMSRFAAREVIVVGAGSSASDCAAALVAAGAAVTVVARAEALAFHEPPQARRWFDPLLWPVTTIGTGWESAFCTGTPDLFHLLPRSLRHRITREHLGPVGCWFTRDAVVGKVRMLGGSRLVGAAPYRDRVRLTIERDGAPAVVEADHIIAATGYKVDVGRLSFLDPALRAGIVTADHTPVLSRRFESSVQGLFFVGVMASNSFGPLLRFACGAEFAAGRLSRHLAPDAPRGAVRVVSRPAATSDLY